MYALHTSIRSCTMLWLLVTAGLAAALGVPAGMELVFADPELSPVYLSFSASSPSSSLPSSLTLRPAPSNNRFGCNKYKSARPSQSRSVFVMDRGGGCTFTDKLEHAQRAGAVGVIVVNTIQGMYNQTTGELEDPCLLQCHVSKSPSQSECETKCPAGCALTTKQGNGYFCCVDDTSLVRMHLSSQTTGIPIFSAAYKDSTRLLGTRDKVEIRPRPYSEFDFSLWCLYLFACGVLTGCSYLAARESVTHTLPMSSPSNLESEEHDVSLTAHSSIGFLGGATLSLLILFALVQVYPALTVLCIQLAFAFAASTSLGQILVKLTSSSTSPRRQRVVFSACYLLGLFSIFTRHFAFAWITNNLLGVCVVYTFLLTVSVPNLKVASLLLGVFFLYDIGMVFVTPLLFGGRSVMVEVATAGRASQYLNTEGECVTTVEERLPMLFAVPRLDFWGGYAMLGLGDVVLPGLVVVLARKVDLAKGTGGPR
ncbi:hypothetical protein BASA81_006212 [Batrachochytrium salamandrivorans]|nr:hypothetical protein BASA81_006212 [Batrachochytrium salamandrivorans]